MYENRIELHHPAKAAALATDEGCIDSWSWK